MVTLTVFTPTYNRAYILEKCYHSLCAQTSNDFKWLIIDDGSTDNTRELVNGWIERDNKFEIQYIYKENGGLHTGYNTAIAHMETELSVCIDSDDSMPHDAVERVLSIWDECKNSNLAGIVGLDFTDTGKLVGKRLPDVSELNAASLLCISGMGDKKYIVRNDLLRQIAPMPVFEGEKNFNPHYFIIRLSRQFKFKPVNQCFCLVDYQENGMSANIYNQYLNSPKSFAELRKEILKTPGLTLTYRFKTAIHYVSSSFIAKDMLFIFKSPSKVLTLAAVPFGLVLTGYIYYKTR